MKIQLEMGAGLNQIRAYAPGQVTVNQTIYTRSLIVTPQRVIADWPPLAFAELDETHFEILAGLKEAHAKGVTLAKDVDFKVLAGMTPGFVGADLANVINEGALLAVRRGKKAVGMAEMEEAIERLVAGLEKKTRVMNEQERRIVTAGAA